MTANDILAPLHATALGHAYGHRLVLDGIDLLAAPGSRIGVVGENGSGKSTLLRLLAGIEQPDEGVVARPSDVVLVTQEQEFPAAASVGDVLAAALQAQHVAVRRVEELAAGLAADPASAQAYDARSFGSSRSQWSISSPAACSPSLPATRSSASVASSASSRRGVEVLRAR